ncbi:TonB-dependent receptor [Erythrobacter sp. LQ02-29]|uniref:TonB-dependent receptor n=1 Tax=Erythrobacter sp. LQ02-29 TaxID=2920384 RepID=UPI001F4D3715|nr:TonB-dependent receptor [Erythrobacter sp. LQ02-29]
MNAISRRNMNRGTAPFLAIGCIGFIASAPAQAEEAAAPPDTIVVNGARLNGLDIDEATATVLDTPRTINIVSEKTIEQTASYSLEDALRTVPGITLGAGEGGTASADIPLIRGIDATGDIFVDGARDIGTQTRDTFAVEQIEVFKGPSGAFGGRGAAAGGINLVSKTAREGSLVAGTASIGTADLYRATADINQQIGDRLAVRVAALYHQSDVAGRNAVHDERWGVSPSIAFGVGTDTVARLTHYHFESDGIPDYGIPLTSRGQLPGGVRRPADVDYDNFYGLLVRDFQKTRVDATTFQFDTALSTNWSASALLRYSNSRNDYIVTNPDDSAGNVANGYVWRNIKSRNALTESMTATANVSGQFATGGIEHSLSTGVEYSWADTFNRNYSVDTGNYRFNGPGTGCLDPSGLASYNCTDLQNPNPADPWSGAITPSTSPSTADAEDISVYAFDSITLMPQIIVNTGVRYTDYRAGGAGSGRGGPYSGSVKTDFVSWQAGVIFKPAPWASIYASYANAKNPPGTDVGAGSGNIPIQNDTYAPQETENYEIGAKADLFGGSMQLSGAVFQVDRNNIIQTDGLGNVTEIIDSARIRGFELGATGRAGPLSVFGGYSYIDSELPNSPRNNMSLNASLAVTPRFEFGGGVYHQSSRFADTTQLVRADGYWRVDAFASFAMTDRIKLQLNVKNVGDERYVVKLRNPHFAVPAQGRQAILSLSARY